jgi:hypothetical protein
MTRQEEWNSILDKIEELNEKLMDIAESSIDTDDETDNALFGLRISIDELREQEL